MAATYEPGATLPELKVHPDRFITVRYAGASGDFNPIHIDEEFAKSVGLPGRILISIAGVVIAGLAITGIFIWWRKRRSRALFDARRSGRA